MYFLGCYFRSKYSSYLVLFADGIGITEIPLELELSGNNNDQWYSELQALVSGLYICVL